MNETILRFGYPATLIEEYDEWVVLLRPSQPTLGSLILAAKSEVTRFSDLHAEAFVELQEVLGDIEDALGLTIFYEQINYLMLMMVDRHVHFHVIPRYKGDRSACGVTLLDPGWPKAPDLGQAVELKPAQIGFLVEHFKGAWPSPL